MSDDPVRLVDDSSAPADLRADLGRAAEAPPPAFELEGGLARLSAAIGALPGGGGPSSPGGGGSSVGGAAQSGALAGAKAGGVLGSGVFWAVTACGVVGAAFMLLSPSEPPRAVVAPPAVTAVSGTTTDAPAPAPSSTPTETTTNERRDDAPATEPSTAPTTEALTPHAVGRREATKAATAALDPAPAPTTADEIRDLEALRGAQGDPARALELASAGARRFPGGVFSIEREAISIDALSRLGRAPEARSRAAAFVAAHPKSVYVEQVRRAGHL